MRTGACQQLCEQKATTQVSQVVAGWRRASRSIPRYAWIFFSVALLVFAAVVLGGVLVVGPATLVRARTGRRGDRAGIGGSQQ